MSAAKYRLGDLVRMLRHPGIEWIVTKVELSPSRRQVVYTVRRASDSSNASDYLVWEGDLA